MIGSVVIVAYLLACCAFRDRKQRLLNLLIAVDQAVYVVLTLGRGHPDMTISAAAYRAEIFGKWLGVIFRPLIDLLLLPLEREHCHKSYLAELRRTQLPEDMRKAA